MKKNLFFTMCLGMSAAAYAQQITGVKVAEVLASDDFEGKTPWVNFDTADNLSLNNALGGTQDYSWSGDWGGALVHEGKSAISGNQCVELEGVGTLVLRGFEIDITKIYQLEVAVHPQGSMDGTWNDWGGVQLFIIDDSDLFGQSRGVRVRITGKDPAGANPFHLYYETWYGDAVTYTNRDVLDISGNLPKYSIDAVGSVPEANFWFPLKLVFKGAGTAENPLIIDFYLNGSYVDSQAFDDVAGFGEYMIGLQKIGVGDDNVRFDNFKLSLMEEGEETAIEPISVATQGIASLKVYPNPVSNGQLTIDTGQLSAGDKVKIYNVNGSLAGVYNVSGGTNTTINIANLPTGTYIVKAGNKEAKVVKQ